MSTQYATEVEHAESEFPGAGGLRLYYQSWRPRAVPPRAVMALVHGFGGHSGLYGRLVDGLVGAQYAVYGFDHRGMGRSPGQRGYAQAWSELQEDLGAFLHLIGEREPEQLLFLAGESMGGLIVLEYAKHHPEGLRGVIAFSPVLSQPEISPFLLLLARILSRVWPRFSLDTGMNFSAASRDPDFVQRLRDDPLVHSRGTARLGAETPVAIERARAGVADLSLPLLILHGDADRIISPDGSRTFFENVVHGDKELHECEDGYHMLLNDVCADEVVRDVERWIERHL